ncbi:MAG: DUF308 domain-containing protein [Bacteroidales bacterium]|nr:DUF308 domain-containing protein [Bacteroidales bacterium]
MKSNLFVNWWVFALNGVIALLYGLLAIFAPVDTLKVIITYFGIVVLIIGAALLIGAISNARKGYPYFSDLISAIVAIALGAVLAFYTSSAIKIFMYIVGGWALLVGIVQLVMLARDETPPGSKKSLLVNGLVTLGFGILLFFTPLGTASALVWISGILAFIIGIMLIVLGMQMKNITVEYEDAEE